MSAHWFCGESDSKNVRFADHTDSLEHSLLSFIFVYFKNHFKWKNHAGHGKGKGMQDATGQTWSAAVVC